MHKHQLSTIFTQAIRQAQQQGTLPSFTIPTIEVVRPADEKFGDYAVSVAMKLAREAKMSPLQIAQAIAAQAPRDGMIGKVEVAPPGFINIRLNEKFLAEQVNAILQAGRPFGNVDVGQGKRAMVEFVSANPTGPLHIGRTWGAVVGDTLARLLEASGYQVTREYYFNNAGQQMRMLGESVRARYLELLGVPTTFPEGGYQGEYIYDIARNIIDELGNTWREEDWSRFKERAEAWMFANIRKTLERMGIVFDVWFNENDLYKGAIDETLKRLRERGYAYAKDGAVWFKAMEFGADKDRVLIKSSGEPTYRMPDIAYHVNKLGRGFDLIVNVFGADHKDEYPDVIAGVRALGLDAERIRVVIHQFINLVRDGKQVRMSTRRANYVTLDDLLDEVTFTHPESGVTIPGKDPVRFMLLTRSANSAMNFDIGLVTKTTNENPVYYVQYAHARIASIIREAKERGQYYDDGDVRLLTRPAEYALIRKLLELPEQVENATRQLTPHLLSHYAQSLASTFHAFYHDCRVLPGEGVALDLSQARMKLVRATKQVLARTLGLMGMSAPESM
jgi:arginyl-tRNA synthetase